MTDPTITPNQGSMQTGIEVQLIGRDGNAFAVLGACYKAIRESGLPQAQQDEIKAAFEAEATSGDYDQLLGAAMRFFEVI